MTDALELAHYQSIESIDLKTTYIAVGTGSVARGVRHLDQKADLQIEETQSVHVAVQKQTEMMNKVLAVLNAVGNNKDRIADANSRRAEEAAPEDLHALLLNKVLDALISKKSTLLQFEPYPSFFSLR